eukprot:CAMPEP_0202010548 /NCGR_PEP_ID=MMETSP0905-20130828/17628_1 /ASSEMBLY_ACC=CAM_ASM_000554 /TAXON_ID=420261 /ORGANISM="Thalassiosira antarctica, Strain CCMP982" /LENGTH=323 /DNA_ID=CAMNT_0048569171 /DNA_START=45 /DNA_END=1016 /DNA_ORIENTATION=-
MMRYYFHQTIAIYAAFMLAYIPQLATSQQIEESPSRRLEIAVLNSDEYADSILTIQAPKSALGIGSHDHAKITSILETTKDLIGKSSVLVQNERTLKDGQEMMEQANAKFLEVKDNIRQINDILRREEEDSDKMRHLLRKKYSEHDVQKAQEDDERMLDVTRSLYETIITFPECVELLFDDCLAIINEELESIGLTTIEVVVHEKRNANQDSYNKVVIVTNELADRVLGRSGDGIVQYPFLWNDSQSGPRALGVDGKWSCHDFTPEQCCSTIKDSVPNPDFGGNIIECHIFVPFGGVGNPRQNDRVFIKLSPDGRVHEPPIIQ